MRFGAIFMLRISYIFSIFSLSLLSAFFCVFVYAAGSALSLDKSNLIRNFQKRLLQEQKKYLDALQQLPNKSAVLSPGLIDKERCFAVKEFYLQGADYLGKSEKLNYCFPLLLSAWVCRALF